MPDKTKRQKRLENGYCGQCGTNKVTGSPTCDTCKEKLRRYHKKVVIERKIQEMCTSCGQNRPVQKMKTCQQCLDKCAAYRIARDGAYENNRRVSRDKLKRQIMDHYGGNCVCCEESDIRFLTIDHINDNGKEHRKQGLGTGDSFYRWLRKSEFPTEFRTLCYNCNIGRYHNGGVCPHKDVPDGV